MKRIFFIVLMFAAAWSAVSQENGTQIIAKQNVLTVDVNADYDIMALKKLQQSKLDGFVLDARALANEDFLASASMAQKSVFFKIEKRADVDPMVSAAGRYFKPSQVKFVSDNLAICEAILKQVPRAKVIYAGDEQEPKALSKAGLSGVQYSLDLLLQHPELAIETHAYKLAVLVDAGSEVKAVATLSSADVDYIFTEEPYLVQSQIDNRNILKVMSFNIRMCGMSDLDGDNRWDNRKEAIIKMLNEQAPDLLGVQEMLPAQKEYLVQNLKDSYKMIGIGRDDGKKEGEVMGIFYNPHRFELKEKATYWLSETPEEVSKGWDAACKRTVTYVQLIDNQSGRIVCYFNTHLDHVGEIARHESVNLLVELIHKLAPDGAVVILGGDMNTDLTNGIFEPLRSNNILVARETAFQTDNILSYNAYGKGTPACIDNLFYLNAKALVFRTLTKDYGVPYISDHYPVIGFFEL